MFDALTDDEDRTRYEAALYDLRSEIERIRNNAAFAQHKLASAQEILMGELSKAESDMTCLRDRCDQLQDDNARLAYANNDLMRVNKQLNDELLRLKARLFDLVDQSEVEKQLKAIPSQ